VLGIAVAAVLTFAAVTVGVQLLHEPGDQAPRATPSPSPTAIQDVDLTALPIPRGPFCDLVDDDSLVTALGGPVSSSDHYGNGDQAQLAPGVRDISHEYSCTFDTASGAQARAWVFAAPVQTAEARTLGKQAAGAPGCRPIAGKLKFGRPSTTTACRRHGASEVTLRGLFGDAWFSCQLTLPGTTSTRAAVRSTQRWCVHVAETVGAQP
jgi:hypothetical protein